MALKAIKKRLNNPNHLPQLFNGKILEHYSKDQKNGKYIHSCGEYFYTFKYKLIYNRENLFYDKEDNKIICVKCQTSQNPKNLKWNCLIYHKDFILEIKDEEYKLLLICIKSECIYKSDLVKFHCNSTDIDFYSKIIDNNLNKNILPFATWKRYHCNAVINDTMKCNICKENLFYDKENNMC